MRDNERTLLLDGIRELGLHLSPQGLDMLERFIDEIVLWNGTYKLVAAEGEDLITNHLLDAIAPYAYIESSLREIAQAGKADESPLTLADLGSGNGFPGIPLAVMIACGRSVGNTPLADHWQVRLVERSGRRVGFLRNVLAVTGLGKALDIDVIEADITESRQKFDLLVFRAFRPLPEIAPSIDRCLADGGVVLAYKGKSDVLAEELEELEQSLPGVWSPRILPVKVPGSPAERSLCRLTRRLDEGV